MNMHESDTGLTWYSMSDQWRLLQAGTDVHKKEKKEKEEDNNEVTRLSFSSLLLRPGAVKGAGVSTLLFPSTGAKRSTCGGCVSQMNQTHKVQLQIAISLLDYFLNGWIWIIHQPSEGKTRSECR